MSVVIKNYCKGKLPINIEKRVGGLLKYVPQKYLRGLKMITILNVISHRKHKDASGLYYSRSKNNFPRIEIAIDTIYQGFPKIFMLTPLLAKYFLARVLYHEIGHHYQHENKDMKKINRERYAEKVSKELLKKYLFWWKIPLFPLYPITVILKEINKKNDN